MTILFTISRTQNKDSLRELSTKEENGAAPSNTLSIQDNRIVGNSNINPKEIYVVTDIRDK